MCVRERTLYRLGLGSPPLPERLLASGDLQRYLVDAPTGPQRRGARMLGAFLITVGLILLTLVITGFLGV